LGTAREIAKGVVIGLVVNSIILGLPYLARALGLNLQYDLLQMEVPLWIAILTIIVLIPTIFMVSRQRRKGGFFVSTGRSAPESKFHDLGSSAVWKTSDTSQVDLFGNRMGNYCIIFGKILPWDEIKWHVKEAYRLEMVNKGFAALREFGSITIRVNSKNNKIPPPKPLYYFRNGDSRGITAFTKHWKMCRNMGKV